MVNGFSESIFGIPDIDLQMRTPFKLYRKDELPNSKLSTIFGLDAEAELTRILSEQISEQINRDVIHGLISNDIVEVRPFDLPTGQLFFLDFVYTPNRPVEYITLDISFNESILNFRPPFKLKRKNERNKLKFSNERD